jgi:hypothetical protein
MSAQHTPGRLQAGVSLYGGGIEHFTAVSEGNTQKIVALCGLAGAADELESIANACRLAACWNACEGLDTDKLERMPAPFGQMLNVGFMDLWEQYATLKAQRAELLEALQACDEAMSYMSEYDIPLMLPAQVKAAIAKATGAAE